MALLGCGDVARNSSGYAGRDDVGVVSPSSGVFGGGMVGDAWRGRLDEFATSRRESPPRSETVGKSPEQPEGADEREHLFAIGRKCSFLSNFLKGKPFG
jgi:hypothetical protein